MDQLHIVNCIEIQISHYVNVALFHEVTLVAITAVHELDTTSVYSMICLFFSLQLLRNGILILLSFKGIVQYHSYLAFVANVEIIDNLQVSANLLRLSVYTDT